MVIASASHAQSVGFDSSRRALETLLDGRFLERVENYMLPRSRYENSEDNLRFLIFFLEVFLMFHGFMISFVQGFNFFCLGEGG